MYEEEIKSYGSMDEYTAMVAAHLASNLKIEVKPAYTFTKGIDHRTHKQKFSPRETYNTFLKNPGSTIEVTSGTQSGLTAILCYTQGPGTGIHYLIDNGFICPKCDLIIKTEVYTECEPDDKASYHTVVLYTGKNLFRGCELSPNTGVLIKKAGHQIILPPGISKTDLGYKLITEIFYISPRSPFLDGIRYMSDDLLNAIRLSERNENSSTKSSKTYRGMRARMFDPIYEGGRDFELTRRAGYLIGFKKYNQDEALKILLKINLDCCKPPLPEEQVGKIIRSISKKHSRHV